MDTLRLAVIGTPRSGNTWLRRLLSAVYSLEEISAHRPDEVDWNALPDRAIVQLHWRGIDSLRSSLQNSGVRVVAPARHPLDTLISLLHYVKTYPGGLVAFLSNPALGGEGGDERALFDASPLDPAFLEYCLGPRARTLLSVTRDWWRFPETIQVRYENLVHAPDAELERIVEVLGRLPKQSIAEAVEANRIDRLRVLYGDRGNHFWQGRPGLWRELLPAPIAQTIFDAHASFFAEMGHSFDPDLTLTVDLASTRWLDLSPPPSDYSSLWDS